MTYLYLSLLVFVGALIQSTIGFGFSVIVVAVLPLMLPYQKAIAINICLALVNNVYLSTRNRKNIEWKVLLPMAIPSLIVGAFFSNLSFSFNQELLMTCLGYMLVAISLYTFIFSKKVSITPTPLNGSVIGVISGVCYGLFSIGGPTAAIYLLPALKDKNKYFAALVTYFAMSNILNLSIRLMHHSLELADFRYVIVGLAAMFTGTTIGRIGFRKIKQEVFSKVVYGFIGLNGIWIIVRNLIK